MPLLPSALEPAGAGRQPLVVLRQPSASFSPKTQTAQLAEIAAIAPVKNPSSTMRQHLFYEEWVLYLLS